MSDSYVSPWERHTRIANFRADVRAVLASLIGASSHYRDNADEAVDRAIYFARLIEQRLKTPQ